MKTNKCWKKKKKTKQIKICQAQPTDVTFSTCWSSVFLEVRQDDWWKWNMKPLIEQSLYVIERRTHVLMLLFQSFKIVSLCYRRNITFTCRNLHAANSSRFQYWIHFNTERICPIIPVVTLGNTNWTSLLYSDHWRIKHLMIVHVYVVFSFYSWPHGGTMQLILIADHL